MSMKSKVLTHMGRELRRDRVAPELVDCTVLAENAAHAFEADDWLDDPEHWVWSAAVEARDKYREKLISYRG